MYPKTFIYLLIESIIYTGESHQHYVPYQRYQVKS